MHWKMFKFIRLLHYQFAHFASNRNHIHAPGSYRVPFTKAEEIPYSGALYAGYSAMQETNQLIQMGLADEFARCQIEPRFHLSERHGLEQILCLTVVTIAALASCKFPAEKSFVNRTFIPVGLLITQVQNTTSVGRTGDVL